MPEQAVPAAGVKPAPNLRKIGNLDDWTAARAFVVLRRGGDALEGGTGRWTQRARGLVGKMCDAAAHGTVG
jgi:hypothetical protein